MRRASRTTDLEQALSGSAPREGEDERIRLLRDALIVHAHTVTRLLEEIRILKEQIDLEQ